jgi:hypothetical protein
MTQVIESLSLNLRTRKKRERERELIYNVDLYSPSYFVFVVICQSLVKMQVARDYKLKIP